MSMPKSRSSARTFARVDRAIPKPRQERAFISHRTAYPIKRVFVSIRRPDAATTDARSRNVTGALYPMLETYSIFIVVAALVAFAKLFSRKPAIRENLYQKAPSLVTHTESQFYQQLRAVVGPQAVIQCKVRLADVLIAPPNNLTAFRKVSQKHVDFLLCERITLRPLLAIELDDASHQRQDRKRRDKFVDSAYKSANLPILHIPVHDHYDPAQLLAQIQPHIAPGTPTPQFP